MSNSLNNKTKVWYNGQRNRWTIQKIWM